MGLIEPMAITSALSTAVIPLGSPLALWFLMIGMLTTAACGIVLAVPRPQRVPRGLRVVRQAEAS